MPDYFYYEKSTFGRWQPRISYGEEPAKVSGYGADTPPSRSPLYEIDSFARVSNNELQLLTVCMQTWPAPQS